MCDAVQDESYHVDGVAVSNFVLPLYFTRDAEPGSRNDFLGRRYHGRTLASFGINPGGYIGFFNPKTRQHETYALEGDEKARRRLRIKSKAQRTRRSMRYRTIHKAAVREKQARQGAVAPPPRVEQIKSSASRSGPGVE
jgi:hypothetical protein